MIVFRWRRTAGYSLSPTLISLVTKPFFTCLFLFFFTSSMDLLNVNLLIFKVKLTNFIAALFFLLSLLTFRSFSTPLKIFVITLLIVGSMTLSTTQSSNHIACAGFIFFFFFNYLVYFSLTYNLFRFISPEKLFEIYSKSFFLLGMYALCQGIFFIAGIILPGVTQSVSVLARAQGFSYEPSYYALYITPYAMFYNTRFLLQNPIERKIKDIIWPNILLLISTSTGCFFSYVFFIFFIATFKTFKILKNINLSISKFVIKISVVFTCIFSLIWLAAKDLIVAAFLKFFYSGFGHHSAAIRWKGIIDYWNVFLEHPWLGVGLGSARFYLFQKYSPTQELDLLTVSAAYTPSNVTTEILASVGVLGGILFLVLLYSIWKIFRSAVRISLLLEQERINLIALGISLCVTLATLQFNQSIMRAYIWIHIGFLLGYSQYLKQKYCEISTKNKNLYREGLKNRNYGKEAP